MADLLSLPFLPFYFKQTQVLGLDTKMAEPSPTRLYIQTSILGNLSESLLGNRPPLPCLQTNNGQMTWSSSKMALILYLCNVYVQTLLKQLLPAFHVLCN